jgi:hypothetical protein
MNRCIVAITALSAVAFAGSIAAYADTFPLMSYPDRGKPAPARSLLHNLRVTSLDILYLTVPVAKMW